MNRGRRLARRAGLRPPLDRSVAFRARGCEEVSERVELFSKSMKLRLQKSKTVAYARL